MSLRFSQHSECWIGVGGLFPNWTGVDCVDNLSDVVPNFALSALINARFDSVNNRAEQLKTELATLKTELDSKNEQITAITNRIEQLEIQMETKHDQIGIILLFLVLYLAVCASPLFEGLHSK